MTKRTALHPQHLAANAKMVDFFGWEMPLHYGSQIEEHHAVRQDAGMFDVSHMTIVDVEGSEAKAYLQHLLANNVDKLKLPGKALYSCMLNDEGGVIDDLIAYYFDDTHYRLVVNSATRDKDVPWIEKQAKGFDVAIHERDQYAMLAVQGPNARDKVHQVLDQNWLDLLTALKPFQAFCAGETIVARTGYTGEQGYEIMGEAAFVQQLWQDLLAKDVAPCGLGARDTLRLEAGMNLYGNDMDETTSPLESNLTWTIAFEPVERNFIGRNVLEKEKAAGIKNKLVGLVLEGKGVLRSHQKVVVEGVGEGEVTSGTFSPSLKLSIALARLPMDSQEQCCVEIRNKLIPARIVDPCFVRQGKSMIEKEK